MTFSARLCGGFGRVVTGAQRGEGVPGRNVAPPATIAAVTAALEAQGAGCVGHAVTVFLQLRENHFALVRFHAFGQSSAGGR